MNSASLLMSVLLTSGQPPVVEKGPPPSTQPGATAPGGVVVPPGGPGVVPPGGPPVVAGTGGCGPGCGGPYVGGYAGDCGCCDPCASSKGGILSRLKGRLGGFGKKGTSYSYAAPCCDGCSTPAPIGPHVHPVGPPPGGTAPPEIPGKMPAPPGKTPDKPAGTTTQIVIPNPMIVPAGGAPLNAKSSPY